MSERYDKCPYCEGKGELNVKDEQGNPYKLECGSCEGEGFWGGAFQPEWWNFRIGEV